MKKSLCETYQNERPVAVESCNAFFGLYYYAPNASDAPNADFITAFSNGETVWNFRRSRVKYTVSDKPYVNRGGRKWYLDNAMRTNF